MEKLKTATGKEFDCDYFNPFPLVGQINIRILGESLATIATVFANPAETVGRAVRRPIYEDNRYRTGNRRGARRAGKGVENEPCNETQGSPEYP